MSAETARLIHQRLEQNFAPSVLEVQDDSALHARHPGARQGGGHYQVHIVADAFAGKSTVLRHRMIYQALGELMKSDIHALAIKALSTTEAVPPTHP